RAIPASLTPPTAALMPMTRRTSTSASSSRTSGTAPTLGRPDSRTEGPSARVLGEHRVARSVTVRAVAGDHTRGVVAAHRVDRGNSVVHARVEIGRAHV